MLVTIKLPGTGRHREDLQREVELRLGDVLYDIRLLWLVNNTASERCLVARMRDNPSEATLSTVWWAEGVVPREKGAPRIGKNKRVQTGCSEASGT